TSPDIVLRNRMSASASALKSPVPAMLHGAPGLDSMVCAVTLRLLICQICGVPTSGSPPRGRTGAATSWNRMSDCRSPSKSFCTPAEIVMVVVTVLWLKEPAPSLSTQLSVRVVLAPELPGLGPEEKATESSTWL